MITHLPDGRAIYYCTQGTGPDLLIIHCAAGNADTYPALVNHLSLQFRCITFDRLGYSRSTHLDRLTTVAEQVAAIATVHQEVTSEPVWVFAHSGGGNFALAYALAHPDRVKGLILMEPALYAIYPASEKPPEVRCMEEDVLPLFQQGAIAEGRAAFFALLGWPANSPLTEPWRFFGYEQPVIINWCPSKAELQQLSLPVLIIEGDKSPDLLRNIGHRLVAQLGNATLVTLIDQDHHAPWTAPQLITTAITAYITETGSKL